ncbi:MAG: hypothetical protein ACLS27_05685 [Eubacterium sp.]
MSEIYIKWDKIRSESADFQIFQKLSQHADTVLNVANKLEISDDVKELLKRNLRSEAENISQLSEKSLKFGTVVTDASDKYQSTENGLTEG